MNTKQLINFLTVYKYCSIKKAAEELQVSEQAVSKSLIDFEKSIHVKLFHRNRNLLIPSKSAPQVKKAVVRILEDIDLLMGQNPENFLPPAITFYAVENTAVSLTCDFFTEFSKKHPDILLNFMETNEKHVEDLLETDEIGFAVLNHEMDPRKYENDFLFTHHFLGLINKNDPLADREMIYNSDLNHRPIVTNGRSYECFVKKTTELMDSNIHMILALETNSSYLIQEMAEKNLAIGLILENAARVLTLRNTKLLPIETPNGFEYYLCYKKNRQMTSDEKCLISFIRKWSKSMSEHSV